jgi:DNA-binding response OmpR family regulator
MRKPRILIADDEPNIVLSLEFLMQRAGYAVEVVDNGEEAFRRASEEPPDLMLLDVMLPRLSGFEVCQRLRALPACRSLPIVMLTAKGRDGEVSKGLALGATAYVTKPFSVQDLVGQVKRILDSAG